MAETIRRVEFYVLQALVLADSIVILYEGVNEFVAAAGGDATILFMSAILLLLAVAGIYLTIALRSRRSTPFYTAIAVAFVVLILLYAIGPLIPVRIAGILLALLVLLMLLALRNRFQLRPGEFVKEEKLPPETVAKISTRVQGVRCKECGDDDVWLTSDRLLVCRNCGSTDA